MKPFNRAKSRLASVLDSEQRERFSRNMMEQTLRTALAANGINGVLVISRDSAALALARRYSVQTVQESGAPELNRALTRASQFALSQGAEAVLVLASDIPMMRVKDIESILALGKYPDVIVLATDRRDDGTNALLMRPPGIIAFRYGVGSFHKHQEEARKRDIKIQIYASDTIALDVDIPADLDLYREMITMQGVSDAAWLGVL
ncbi:MAG: 2-phospho-L-lactate guanylyltransferase [Chloroflexi bacterium]|nr:2-phospho-L-lactate guanylyltransferase [Chloroflexota bacterium]